MRTFGKWLGRVLPALVLAAVAVGLSKREEISRLWAVHTLFDADRIAANFSNMEAAFLTAPVSRGDGPVAELPDGPDLTLPEGAGDWLRDRAVTSLLVLQGGRILHESHQMGTSADDRRISWAMAKSYLSALFGTVVAEGAIASLDDPVTIYAPQLAGGAYDRATIRDVLRMSSGVTFDEDYLDYQSDINRMGRVIALGGTIGEGVAFVLGGLNLTTRDCPLRRDDRTGRAVAGSADRPRTLDHREHGALGPHGSGRDRLRLPVVDPAGRRWRRIHGTWHLRASTSISIRSAMW